MQRHSGRSHYENNWNTSWLVSDAGFTYRMISQATSASNGSIAAEIRELKKELEEKKELDKTIQDREYRSIKEELAKTKAKMASLHNKMPEEEKEKLRKNLSELFEPEKGEKTTS